MTKITSSAEGNERLLSYGEVAAILSCSIKTVRRRVESGELAVVRDGRLRRVRPADLDRYVRIRHALQATTPPLAQ